MAKRDKKSPRGKIPLSVKKKMKKQNLMKKKKLKKRNLLAKLLRLPRLRMQIIQSKKIYNRKKQLKPT